MSIQGLWTATTSNSKTGPVPTLAVGATREQSLESCRDCGLLKGNRADNKRVWVRATRHASDGT